MHNELDDNDDRLFDRLVDGELSPGERRRLLTSLDDRPGGWRQCALAFLEAQSWREEFGDLAGDAATAADVRRLAEPRPESRRRAIAWLATAASLLVAFTLGLAYGGISAPPHSTAAPDLLNSMASATPADDQIDSEDVVVLWVRDEMGRSQSLRVPLVDAAAVDRRLGMQFQSGVSADVREQLLERGYQVESNRRYAPLWLEDGRPLVLPVEDTKIIPVSHLVY